MKKQVSGYELIAQLKNQGMDVNVHWFLEDVSIDQLAATLAGMANTIGGVVWIGIAPQSGIVQGVHNQDWVIDRIYQAALVTEPPLVIPLPQVVAIPEGVLIKVTVPPGLPNVYNFKGRYYERRCHQTIPLSARRQRALLIERGVVRFEMGIPPNATLTDLDEEKVASYMSVLNQVGSAGFEELLLRRGCLAQNETGLRPTYAALLLFGKYPHQWLPNASILAARFPGSGLSDQFIKQDIRGTLFEQIQAAETFVKNHLTSLVRLVGLTRQETLEYPMEAIRELLVNAVAHRDYNLQGDTIHVNIFSDRLEISSPGYLPGPVNLDNILVSRFSRNAVISQILSDLGFVERLGYGLNRVVTVLRQSGMVEPKFEEIGGSFRVTLYNTPLVSNLENSPQVLADYADHLLDLLHK